jgi:type I restriction enzyme S subunit
MSEWKEVKLKTICSDISYGYTASASKENVGPKFLRITDITSGKINWDTVPYCKISEKDYHKYKLSIGDIVIARTGATTGCNAIVKNNIDAVFASYLVRFKIDKKFADPFFIGYVLQSQNFKDYVDAIIGGSAQPGANARQLADYIFSLPPLPEQKSIAEVLSSIDDKIDLLHRQNKTLEEMAMTLFRKWFIEDAKEDWGDGVFGDIVQPKKGKNITKKDVIEGPYPVVAGGIEPSCYHNLANTSEPVVTISASGANAGYVRLYHTKVWASDSSYIDYSVTPYVYFSYIFLKTNQKAIFDKQVGSVQPHVYPMQIMELNCMHYPEKLISKFEKWCTPMFTKIKSNQLQIRTLEQSRDTLLPKLMSGEVRIMK